MGLDDPLGTAHAKEEMEEKLFGILRENNLMTGKFYYILTSITCGSRYLCGGALPCLIRLDKLGYTGQVKLGVGQTTNKPVADHVVHVAVSSLS